MTRMLHRLRRQRSGAPERRQPLPSSMALLFFLLSLLSSTTTTARAMAMLSEASIRLKASLPPPVTPSFHHFRQQQLRRCRVSNTVAFLSSSLRPTSSTNGIRSTATSTTASALAALPNPSALSILSAANTASASVLLGLLLRGGATKAGAATAAINFSREGYHLQVMATYGTMTALVMNAALRLFTSTKFPSTTSETSLQAFSKKQLLAINIASLLFLLTTSLCIISGAFTAILFQLLGIYGKSALSMQNDVGYLSFQSATGGYATWGFRCFLTSLASFVASFLLSLSTKTIFSRENKNVAFKENSIFGNILSIGNAQIMIFTISILLTLVGAYHLKLVLNLASKYIFIPEFAERFWSH